MGVELGVLYPVCTGYYTSNSAGSRTGGTVPSVYWVLVTVLGVKLGVLYPVCTGYWVLLTKQLTQEFVKHILLYTRFNVINAFTYPQEYTLCYRLHKYGELLRNRKMTTSGHPTEKIIFHIPQTRVD